MFSDADMARFRALVSRSKDSECWPWQGKIAWNGYGKFHANGRQYTASRIALQTALGRELLASERACHRCDNRPCCNPSHLFVGDDAANRADCVAKGRAFVLNGGNAGASNPRARLSPTQVAEIRSLKGQMLQREVALIYDVSRQTISAIQNGDRWLVSGPVGDSRDAQPPSQGTPK